MSILKDLDPQYAKLHAEPLLRKPVTWAGIALLTLGSSYWVATQSTNTATPEEGKPTTARQALAQSAEAPANKDASTDPLPENAKKQGLQAMPATPPAATIREEAKGTNASDQQTVQTAANENPARSRLADTEYPRQPQNIANGAAPTPKIEHAKRKLPANQAATKAEKTPGGSGKKSGERDIDIITAIVR